MSVSLRFISGSLALRDLVVQQHTSSYRIDCSVAKK
jgi:hypothetical protein